MNMSFIDKKKEDVKNYYGRVLKSSDDLKTSACCTTDTLSDEIKTIIKNIEPEILDKFYGDQGIFVRKEVFEKLKGFPEVKICEDILFSKRLRRAGKVDILPFPVYCSAHRWKKQGVLKTFFINARIKGSLTFGIHPDRLSILYDDVRD